MNDLLTSNAEKRRNICSIAFASRMGVAVFSPLCELVTSGTMRVSQTSEFICRLNAMRDRWSIQTVIIQAFGSIPDIEQKTLDAVKDVFPEYILVHCDQWNPIRMGYKKRRALAEVYHADKINWPEQVDAILMGRWLWDILHTAGVPFPASYLNQIAQTTRRFPRRQDLSRLQGRIITEAQWEVFLL
ncbi:MAG TPA: hypothetical protein PKZ83_17400 [bacterium]|nr:hypothetical protein [bacterium]HQJ66276.1 hypothetical protein [bacterium]